MPDAGAYNRWQTQFEQERARLLEALGDIIDGGVVEQIHHIGATSVPGLPTPGVVEIGLAVWPFPLPDEAVTAVQSLGYQFIPGYETGPEQRFDRTDGLVQLHFAMVGTDTVLDPVIIRNYLRHEAAAQASYAQAKPDEAQLLAAARQWWLQHHGFAPVQAVAQELKGYPHPWYISSGWALDLFIGQPQRVHHDIDVVVRRQDQLLLQHHLLERGWHLLTPLNGNLEPWPQHMFLHLPRHQVHAHREGAFIDFLVSDIEHGFWRYRREPTIIQSVEQMGLMTDDGLPYLAPELVLLFKSRSTGHQARPKDQQDFERILPRLQPARCAWLRWALLVTEPGHPWLEML